MSEQGRVLYIVKGAPFGAHDYTYHLIADDGELLNSWVCSGAGFAKHDLHDRHPEKIAEWRARFGDYAVRSIGQDDMTDDELTARNHAWWDAHEFDLPS